MCDCGWNERAEAEFNELRNALRLANADAKDQHEIACRVMARNRDLVRENGRLLAKLEYQHSLIRSMDGSAA